MRLGPPFVVVLLLAAASAIAQSEPQNPSPQPVPSPAVTTQERAISEDATPPGERIVDQTQFPPKPSWTSRVFMAPFRAIGPRLERQLARVEQQRPILRVQRFFENPYVRPRVGGLGDGSGFGVGANFTSGDLISRDFRLFGSAHATGKRYLFSTVGLQADHRTENADWTLELAPRYRLRPQEDFWGPGPQSLPTDRTTYDLQERGVALTLRARLPRGFSLGGGVDYSSNSVFQGKDSRFPTTQAVFGETGLAGLSRGAALVGPFAFAEYEGRNVVGNPTSGAYLRFSASSYDSVGADDFGFLNYLLDARGYVPLGTERRTFAIRMIGDFNHPKGDSQIPFFRLARLGDSHTLRGYDTYRFHARNAMAWSLEYHWRLTGGMSALGFTDVGQVFNQLSEFNSDNMRVTYGGGLQFNTQKSVILKVFIGQSTEGTRFFFNFGPTF